MRIIYNQNPISVKKGYPKENVTEVERFVGLGGAGIGDVEVAVFGRDGQIFADEVLEACPPLVREIEPAPHGGETQVDEQYSTSSEEVGIESFLLQPRKLPAPQQVAPRHDTCLGIDC